MRNLRRILAVLMILAFGAGMVVHGVQAGEMMQMAVTDGTDMPMSNDCDGCGDPEMANDAACMPACAGPAAVLPQARLVATIATPYAYAPRLDEHISSASGAPDPHPPRSLILG